MNSVHAVVAVRVNASCRSQVGVERNVHFEY